MFVQSDRPLGRSINAAFAAAGAGALVLSLGACGSQKPAGSEAAASAKSRIAITGPWSRETAEGQDAGGAFMTIINSGSVDDRLIGGSSPVAVEVQVHTVDMTGGIMRMRQLANGLEIPADSTVTLKPGSFHIMLMKLKRPLARGSTVPLTLQFEKAGTVEVNLAVQPVGSQGPAARVEGGQDD